MVKMEKGENSEEYGEGRKSWSNDGENGKGKNRANFLLNRV